MLLILPPGSVELLFVRKPFCILSIRTSIIIILLTLFFLLLLCFLLFLLALEGSNSLGSACLEEGLVGYGVVWVVSLLQGLGVGGFFYGVRIPLITGAFL